MSLEKIFKRFILADFFLCLFLIVYFFTLSLGAEIAEEEVWHASDTISIILMLAYIVNLYFLYKFKPLGKQIYFPLYALSILWVFADQDPDYSYTTNFTVVLEALGTTISGVIIGLLYFSDIKKKFNN